jgi:phosphoglycolate phosphatase-like HAD superfamily hydrolase
MNMALREPRRDLPRELVRARLVVWDFDGVIKESVDVKARAFAALFEWAGRGVTAAVTAHHAAHGGMSRMDKIPLYLEMAGETPTPARVNALCQEFGRLVFQQVVDAPWVPGVEAYLRGNPLDQRFALVSATPADELRRILDALHLRGVFAEVHGAPTTKASAVAQVLAASGLEVADAVFIGDAQSDWLAARAAGMPFVLRSHATNVEVFAGYGGPYLMEFPECLPARNT